MPRKKLRYLCRAIHHGRTIADPHPDPNETAEFPVYSPAERQADTVVHIVGLTLGLAGCAGLAAAVLLRPDAGPRLTLALGLYAVGLMAMLVGSALYNLTDAAAPARKRLFRRLDHAAIFLMIAGTYTPFAYKGQKSGKLPHRRRVGRAKPLEMLGPRIAKRLMPTCMPGVLPHVPWGML